VSRCNCVPSYFFLEIQYPVFAGNFLEMADGPTFQCKFMGWHWLVYTALEHRTWTVTQAQDMAFRADV